MASEWREKVTHNDRSYEVWAYGDSDYGPELHHNLPEFFEAKKTSDLRLPDNSMFAFGKYEWEAWIPETGSRNSGTWDKVPDSCTTLEERQAWVLSRWRMQ